MNKKQQFGFWDEQAEAWLLGKGCIVARDVDELANEARRHGLFVARNREELQLVATGAGFWTTDDREQIASFARDLGFITLTPAQFDILLGASDLDLKEVVGNAKDERKQLLVNIRDQMKEIRKVQRELDDMQSAVQEKNDGVDAINEVLDTLPE